MTSSRRHTKQTKRARSLRAAQTRSEALLWGLLRGKQVCGLEFRRQHPIGPYFADFACREHQLVVEIDGGYHDLVAEEDLRRETELQRMGWQIIRFSDMDVLEDLESIGCAIANELDLEYEFNRRDGGGAGLMNEHAARAPRQSVQEAVDRPETIRRRTDV